MTSTFSWSAIVEAGRSRIRVRCFATTTRILLKAISPKAKHNERSKSELPPNDHSSSEPDTMIGTSEDRLHQGAFTARSFRCFIESVYRLPKWNSKTPRSRYPPTAARDSHPILRLCILQPHRSELFC